VVLCFVGAGKFTVSVQVLVLVALLAMLAALHARRHTRIVLSPGLQLGHLTGPTAASSLGSATVGAGLGIGHDC
jgi:hypothetical protein